MPQGKKQRTLYLEANGVGREVIVTDTVLRGIFGLSNGAKPPRSLRHFALVANLYSNLADVYQSLSYIADWREAFCGSPKLDVEVCNINNLLHFGACLLRIRRYDLVVVSHAATGDDMTILLRAASALARRDCPMLVFIGNEYDLLDEKIDFVRRVRGDGICSQLPLNAAQYLYGDIGRTRILSVPHALNPQAYRPPPTEEDRDIDIGFVGDLYWPFIGDEERSRLIWHFERHGSEYGLRGDIRAGRSIRLPRGEWAKFLQRSKGLIGAESGTYYLNEHGRLLSRAREYNLANRAASFAEIHQRFFSGASREVSGKSISSRHFEPIGTKTCQLLLEGEYNGVLTAGRHYIPVKRDLSNIAEAVREFKDDGQRRAIAEGAYHHVMSGHTYAHRVAGVLATLF